MEKEAENFLALKLFAKDVGVPDALVTDGAIAETSAEIKKFLYHQWNYTEIT